DLDQVDAAGLRALGGQSRARARPDHGLALRHGGPQPLQDGVPPHRASPEISSCSRSAIARPNDGSLMCMSSLTVSTAPSMAAKHASSASGSWNGIPGASSADTPPSGTNSTVGPVAPA